MTLRLRPELKQYLEDAAWKSRKSINEYLNDLIRADMDKS
jgi:predicted HicB family RNase H-like nuclease